MHGARSIAPTHARIYARTHTRTHAPRVTPACIQTRTREHMLTSARAQEQHKHTRLCMPARTHAQLHMLARSHATTQPCTHTYVRAHMLKHTHKCTCAQMHASKQAPVEAVAVTSYHPHGPKPAHRRRKHRRRRHTLDIVEC
jgi:hypothetical protein